MKRGNIDGTPSNYATSFVLEEHRSIYHCDLCKSAMEYLISLTQSLLSLIADFVWYILQ